MYRSCTHSRQCAPSQIYKPHGLPIFRTNYICYKSKNAEVRLALPWTKPRTGERREKKRRVARGEEGREKEPRLVVMGNERVATSMICTLKLQIDWGGNQFGKQGTAVKGGIL